MALDDILQGLEDQKKRIEANLQKIQDKPAPQIPQVIPTYQPTPKDKPQGKIETPNMPAVEDMEQKPMPISRANPKIDADKAIKLRLKGCTLQEIADYFQVSKPSVHERLQRIMPDYDGIDTESFKRNKADLYAQSQAKLLISLTSDKIKEMSGRDTIVGIGILHDKEADLRGTSPAMVGVNAITSLVDALKGYQSPIIEAEYTDIPPIDAPDTGL